MTRNLIVAALVAVVLAGAVLAYTALGPGRTQAAGGAPAVPAVKGYLDRREIRFIHTEASDPQLAVTLTKMVNSPVLPVPALAQVPPTALSNVYVFTNGVGDGGPLGFQPDVFDSPPGTPGYSPLRAVNLITWKNEGAARMLRSVADIKAAGGRGELTIERTGAVVNMPMLVWPGGQR